MPTKKFLIIQANIPMDHEADDAASAKEIMESLAASNPGTTYIAYEQLGEAVAEPPPPVATVEVTTKMRDEDTAVKTVDVAAVEEKP